MVPTVGVLSGQNDQWTSAHPHSAPLLHHHHLLECGTQWSSLLLCYPGNVVFTCSSWTGEQLVVDIHHNASIIIAVLKKKYMINLLKRFSLLAGALALSLCLSVCLCHCLSVCLSLSLSVCLSLSVSLSQCMCDSITFPENVIFRA